MCLFLRHLFLARMTRDGSVFCLSLIIIIKESTQTITYFKIIVSLIPLLNPYGIIS